MLAAATPSRRQTGRPSPPQHAWAGAAKGPGVAQCLDAADIRNAVVGQSAVDMPKAIGALLCVLSRSSSQRATAEALVLKNAAAVAHAWREAHGWQDATTFLFYWVIKATVPGDAGPFCPAKEDFLQKVLRHPAHLPVTFLAAAFVSSCWARAWRAPTGIPLRRLSRPASFHVAVVVSYLRRHFSWPSSSLAAVVTSRDVIVSSCRR